MPVMGAHTCCRQVLARVTQLTESIEAVMAWMEATTLTLQNLERRVTEIMAAQDDVTAAAQALTTAAATITGVANDLTTAVANIQAEITALQQQNPAVDTSALNAAVAGLQPVLDQLTAADTAIDALETPPPAGQ